MSSASNTSYSHSYQISLNTSVSNNIDQTLYRQDKRCTNCKAQFGWGQKKYLCTFCLRGVCNDCSSQRIKNYSIDKVGRICGNCFAIVVMAPDQKEESDQDTQEKFDEVAKLEEMRMLIEGERQQLSEEQEITNSLMIQIQGLRQTCLELDESTKDIEAEREVLQQNLYKKDEELENFYNQFSQQQSLDGQDTNNKLLVQLMEQNRKLNDEYNNLLASKTVVNELQMKIIGLRLDNNAIRSKTKKQVRSGCC